MTDLEIVDSLRRDGDEMGGEDGGEVEEMEALGREQI